MTVRSDILGVATVTLAPLGIANLSTVPADELWIVKEIFVYKYPGAPDGVSVGLKRVGQAAAEFIFLQTIASNTLAHAGGLFTVAKAGTVLSIASTTGSQLGVIVSGARLRP